MAHARRTSAGFTLVELLVVIGIIALLVGILVPVASTIRTRAQGADTASLIRAMDAAARAYFADFAQYPGLLPDNQVGPGVIVMQPGVPTPTPIEIAPTSGTTRFVGNGQAVTPPGQPRGMTGSENFLLSVAGGMRFAAGSGGSGAIVYDPDVVGRGAADLSPGGQGGTFTAYLEVSDRDLSFRDTGSGLSGRYGGDAGFAMDTEIPEIVDRFPNALPILYLRANRRTLEDSPVSGSAAQRPVFNLNHVRGYTAPASPDGTAAPAAPGPNATYIGVGRTSVNDAHRQNNTFHGLQTAATDNAATGLNSLDSRGPFNGNIFLGQRDASTPRNGDSFILISAGPDRVFGTADDITNFGRPLQ